MSYKTAAIVVAISKHFLQIATLLVRRLDKALPVLFAINLPLTSYTTGWKIWEA